MIDMPKEVEGDRANRSVNFNAKLWARLVIYRADQDLAGNRASLSDYINQAVEEFLDRREAKEEANP